MLILRALQDSEGSIWRCKLKNLHVVEITMLKESEEKANNVGDNIIQIVCNGSRELCIGVVCAKIAENEIGCMHLLSMHHIQSVVSESVLQRGYHSIVLSGLYLLLVWHFASITVFVKSRKIQLFSI